MPRLHTVLGPRERLALRVALSKRARKGVHVRAHDRDQPSRLLPRYEQLQRWDKLHNLLLLTLSRSASADTIAEDRAHLRNLIALCDDTLAHLRKKSA